MKAIWNGQVVAESDDTEVVESNRYFPAESVNQEYLVNSSHSSFCPWKGTASYHSLLVDGKENENAVWFYLEPKESASSIKNRVAFWKGVKITHS